MTTERQHTLVGCATCGKGDLPKYMVSVGDDWLCTQCAGAEIGRLCQSNKRMYDAIDWATTETFVTPIDLPDECYPRDTWNRIYERLRAALTESEPTDA